MPQHETEEYETRSTDDITTLVIHHTVSPCDRSTYSIASYHVYSNDWPAIGYGYVIDCDGLIQLTNYHETISYHAGVYGYNNNEVSIGIAMKGDFTTEYPTQEQLDSARALVAYLSELLPNITTVVGHRDMPGASTQCPGNSYQEWMDYIKGDRL